VEKALFASARPPSGSTGWTEQYGYGVIDADAALVALKQLRGADVTELLPDEVQAAREHAQSASASGSPVSAMAYTAADWKAFAWGVALLAFVLLTLGKKERPGLLNILLKPGFFLPLLLTSVGVFFMQYVAQPSEVTTALALPLPDWLNRIIFGRGSLANPLVYSAAIPVVGTLFALRFKSWRSVVGGLAIGFGGILAYSAWAHSPALAWLPFTFLAIPWLLTNALVCLFIARAMLKKAAL
jgi:serine protease